VTAAPAVPWGGHCPDRGEAVRRITAGLKARRVLLDFPWSVKTGRGTSWGWIKITAAPRGRTWGHVLPAGLPDCPENYQAADLGRPGLGLSPVQRSRLAELLGLDSVHSDGVLIPASGDYYREYIDRAEGRIPERCGVPYWD